MGGWFNKAVSYYQALPSRERYVLAFGVPVILTLLLYSLVGRPIVTEYRNLAERDNQLRDDLVWMLEQREYMERINTFCPLNGEVASGSTAEATLRAQSQRFGVNARIEAAADDHFHLELPAVSGNLVLALVRELACRGIALQRMDIQISDTTNNLVRAELVMRLP